MEKRNKSDLLIARDYFQQAVARDTSFAAAFSGLADSFCFLLSAVMKTLFKCYGRLRKILILLPVLIHSPVKHRLRWVTGIFRILTGMPQKSLTGVL